MKIIETPWHLISAALVFFVGFCAVLKISIIFNTKWRKSVALYFWHTVFCFLYIYYIFENGGDAIDYFDASLASDIELALGTSSVVFLTRLFSYHLDFSFLGVSLVYNVFGSIGLLAFDVSLRHASRDRTKMVHILASLLVFLPSVSFWSAGIGKDALSFMAAGLALWAAIDFNRRALLMIFSVLVMLLVRPHIAGLMIIAAAGSVVFQGRISLAKKAALVVLSLAAVAVIVPFALEYSGLGNSNGISDFEDYIEQRQGYNQDGGGGIDISSMSPPMQLFTYVFRPLPFETQSFAALAASFDNIILILIFLLGMFGYFMYRKNIKLDPQENRMFMWIYSLSAWVILAITTANLGISVRQKWMFVPVLVFLLISMMAKRKEFRGNKSGSRLTLRGRVSMKK